MDELAAMPVVIPVAAAAVMLALHRIRWRRVLDALAIGASVLVAGCCVALALQSHNKPVVHWFGGWQPRGGVAIGIAFTVHEASAVLVTLAAVLTAAALTYSWRYFTTLSGIYHGLVMMFLSGMAGFTLTGDLFNLFVFLELMSVAGFALTANKIEEKTPLQAAMAFAATNSVGALMLLMGITLLYGRTGVLDMASVGQRLALCDVDSLVITAFALITTGLFIKAAVVPFHFWLADAHAVAPTPVCVLFSGIMVELGLYGATRVYWAVFAAPLAEHQAALGAVLLTLAIPTMLLGGAMCYGQHHLKRLLAFSTISHIGLLLVGFALASPRGVGGMLVYIVSHGTLKGTLFLCTGILLNRFESVDEFQLHGRGRKLRLTGALFGLSGLGLAGLPPFGTFLGKSLIEESLYEQQQLWLLPVIILSGMLTSGAVLRATARVFGGVGPVAEQLEAVESVAEQPETESTRPLASVPVIMIIPAVVLLGIGLLAGMIPGISRAAEHAAAQICDPAAYVRAVLGNGAAPPAHIAPAATFFSESLLIGFATAAGGAGLAGITLLSDSLPRWVSVCRRPLIGAAILLKRLHSGHVGDYLAWLTLGAAAYGTLCWLAVRLA